MSLPAVIHGTSWVRIQFVHIHLSTGDYVIMKTYLGQGIDPTEKSSLIGNFDSVTTKQRAEKIKKKRV